MGQHLFIQIQTKKVAWLEGASQDLLKKINYFVRLEKQHVKSSSLSRSHANDKMNDETEKVLKLIDKNDYVILFDEFGKGHTDSIAFSKELATLIESQNKRLVFVIGGAFGIGEALKTRADRKWRLSNLTMNHHLALLVALEQIYRGLTIWKGTTYHNK